MPLSTARLFSPMDGADLRVFGCYDLRVLAGDRLVLSRPIRIMQQEAVP